MNMSETGGGLNNKATRRNRKKGDLKQYFFVIRQLASRELKRGNTNKVLGQLWNILTPIISMITLTIIFAVAFHRENVAEYASYIFTGTIIFGFYNGGMMGAMHSLVGNKRLLITTKIPKNLFIIEKIYVSLWHLMFSVIGYVIMLIVIRIPVGPTVFMTPFVVITAAFIIMGIGKILAVIYVYFADIGYFYHVLMRLVFFGSGIFIQPDRLSPAMQSIMSYNPVYLSILFARSCILYNTVPEPVVWIKLIVYAVGFFVIGSIIFEKGSQDIVAKI